MIIKEADISHIEEMHVLRMSVKENQLSNPNLISEEDYINFIDKKGKTWITEEHHKILGFATIDLENKNIWALFVHPEFEKKGIGKKLHQTMIDWYFKENNEKLWLSTAQNTRAEKFYEFLGWKKVGILDNNEIKFELTQQDWKNNNYGTEFR
ncbi:MAG: GNAT family N-acetyltransferase [Cloacibacterium sp.]|nr:GNAT family N-acetyltransferase [Cloacibacterium sp.]